MEACIYICIYVCMYTHTHTHTKGLCEAIAKNSELLQLYCCSIAALQALLQCKAIAQKSTLSLSISLSLSHLFFSCTLSMYILYTYITFLPIYINYKRFLSIHISLCIYIYHNYSLTHTHTHTNTHTHTQTARSLSLFIYMHTHTHTLQV